MPRVPAIKISKSNSLKSKAHNLKHLVEGRLWLQVVIALILGVGVGIFLGPDVGVVSAETADFITNWLALPGNLFLQIVKMIVIPLVFSSIIVGIVSSGSPAFLKRIGPKLALYFVITTTVATVIGFSVALLIQPGLYVDASALEMPKVENNGHVEELTMQNIPQQLIQLLPANPFESIVRGEMLPIVIFTLIMGMAVLFLKKPQMRRALRMLEVVQNVSMMVVRWAMLLVPFAVFGLMTQITSQIGLSSLSGLGMYILTVLLGLFLLLIFYLIIVGMFAGYSPWQFLRTIEPVQLLAFSTSSSAAVMPLSMKTAEDKLQVKPAISHFLIPIGATINMDGTALYQVVATVFLAQVFGVTLPLTSMILIVAVTVGASIGAPSVPGVGIVILASILASVGIPAAGIALILGVDRILDMSRTSMNVTGDLTACMFFNKKLSASFADNK